MIHVSITRLRVRSLWFLPAFLWHTRPAIVQARNAAGFLKGSLLADRKLTFWTMTLWRDQADMRAYISSGHHSKVMPKLQIWCDEASVVGWFQESDTAPDWHEAERRMRTEGRASRLLNPSPQHQTLDFAPAHITRSVKL